MSRIAGIIYPSAFQVTEMIQEVHAAFSESSPAPYFHHKNLELGTWGTKMATNPAKNIWATVDGEIYNKKELSAAIKEKLGIELSDVSNSELIVYAYDAWKEKFLSRLNGPFALAVFDEEKETLFIARDKLGQKPLYWTMQGEYWLFSTDIKGLLATGAVPQTPSKTALASYLYFGFVPQDLAAIQGVNKLLPCHYLKVDLNRRATLSQYWSYSDHLQTQTSLSQEEIDQQLGKHMEEAVRTSTPGEGTIGASLEGDLGSSALAWFLSHLTPRDRLQAYSPSFDDPKNASTIAETLSLAHTTKVIEPEEALHELPKIVWHLDEPIADPFTVQTWLLGKLCSPHSHSLFTHLGWQEMFGGSTHTFKIEEQKAPFAYFLARLSPKVRDTLLLPFLKMIGSPYLYRILRNIDINRNQVAHLMESALFKGRARKKVSPLLFPAFDPEVFTQRFHRLSSLPGALNPTLYYAAKTELPDSLLFQYEKLLTANNVRFINPYLDSDLVEFLAKIPESLKFDSSLPGSLLHRLMARLCHTCPPFSEQSDAFLDQWRKHPCFREGFGLLLKGRLVDEGLISARWIKQQLNYPHLNKLMFRQLWSILVLEIWFQQYIGRPIDFTSSTLSIKTLLN
ncbi:MAG: Asparagine synthetase [glutamine-hydrolyzing] 1 [Chlamydiales bacterium]|nr:Asparagine synthetase [glutamine-hydrolyzing] 1 [Chlamydiales bacterium]